MKRRLVPALILALTVSAILLSTFSPAQAAPHAVSNAAPSAQTSGGFWYTVKAGDTLTAISVRFDVSVAGIMRANKITNPRNIYVGQRLYLPVEPSSANKPPSASPTPSGTTNGTEDVAAAGPAAPTSAAGKVIYISLAKQHLWAYENGKLVYSFVASSGIPTRPTKPGTFRVLSKIPSAWSNIWQLTMPYWLGIYYVGRVENGIHALPINKRGVKLWAGLLGRPASFGCIILSTTNAATLYKWADIGTLVVIR